MAEPRRDVGLGSTRTAGDQARRPGAGRDSGAELLHQSARTRVVRIEPQGEHEPGLVRKEMLGAGAERRLRREEMILRRLAGVEGVPELLDVPAGRQVLVLKDLGGTCLLERLDLPHAPSEALPPTGRRVPRGPMAPIETVRFATGLAQVLARVHDRGVIHKDVSPGNVVVLPDASPLLIDFDLATTFAQERPEFLHQSEIVGTLAYMAPEQTGRTGLPIDQRADLYGLGATLYALTTGRPPFRGSDPLQLIHDHLVRVPLPPHELNAVVPPALSDIIMRLLEKEPDRRYQTAAGLAHDLSRLGEILAAGGTGTARLALGERDFPARLMPPSRLVGRGAETAALRGALDDAIHGQVTGVLVAGPPGVGKSALIDGLRPMVAAAGGWLVTGKSDQYRGDDATSSVTQAMRALARLLLAEPEQSLARFRRRIQRQAGANAGLLAAMAPEFQIMLQASPEREMPEGDDPAVHQARVGQSCLAVLGAVASPQRPLVLTLDDLQWANTGVLSFVDTLLTGAGIPGLLLVGAYRDTALTAEHPLTHMLGKWTRLSTPPSMIELSDLAGSDITELLADMLRLTPDEAARLAEPISARTTGNPYETVELVNALRRDRILVPNETGWTWDPVTIVRYVGDSEPTDLLAGRIGSMPAATQALLFSMACLGGDLTARLLLVTVEPVRELLLRHLFPALEDGLLVVIGDGDDSGLDVAVRFRHDHVQQAAYSLFDEEMRATTHLSLARRLAHLPEYEALAAEQYLHAARLVGDPVERRRVAALLSRVSAKARLSDLPLAERFVTTAITLIEPYESRDQADPLRADLDVQLHAVLCDTGRHEEADAVYRRIEQRTTGPLEMLDATHKHISSLTARGHQHDAIVLSTEVLARLGLRRPDDLPGSNAAGLERLHDWVLEVDEAAEAARPEITDPRIRGIAKLLDTVLLASFLTEPDIAAWPAVEAHRIWVEHGPCPELISPMASAAACLIFAREDYDTAYKLSHMILAQSEARGYDVLSRYVRYLFTEFVWYWLDPLEEVLGQAVRSRAELLQDGDVQQSCYTYTITTEARFCFGPLVDDYLAEAEAGISTAHKIGNDTVAVAWLAHRQLARALRGETTVPGGFDDAEFNEEAYLALLAAVPPIQAYAHLLHALAAMLFGDTGALAHHSERAMKAAAYSTAVLPYRLIHAFSLACQVRAARDTAEAHTLLTEFDRQRAWLAARAAGAPGNYLRASHWIDAERAWALGDFPAAIRAFDIVQRELPQNPQPWQRALITERVGRFHLEYGMEHQGLSMLAGSRDLYRAWGAAGKVAALDREFPELSSALCPVADRTAAATAPLVGADGPGGREGNESEGGREGSSGGITSESIDLMAVLRASQALSSETDLDRLRDRVQSVLGSLTGADSVRMLLWDDDLRAWSLPEAEGDTTESATETTESATETTAGAAIDGVTADEAARRNPLPVSAVRYAERTGEPLLVEDATRDDRFARDPYFRGMEQCSLLAVPIIPHGRPRAMLLLENRLSRGAFTTERLDAVTLIAGQLAVSLENALLYQSLENKVTRRTEELQSANRRLEMMSVTDPLTGLANRRRLAGTLEAQWSQAIEPALPIGLAMIDIDHFKDYNDHYGHLAGDACLRKIAATVQSAIRDTDLVARYGGEEFSIILPGADGEAARVVAERVRTAVERLGEPHAEAPTGILTVSIGTASAVPAPGTDARELIEAADVELYRAKRAGRNRTMSRL